MTEPINQQIYLKDIFLLFPYLSIILIIAPLNCCLTYNHNNISDDKKQAVDKCRLATLIALRYISFVRYVRLLTTQKITQAKSTKM